MSKKTYTQQELDEFNQHLVAAKLGADFFTMQVPISFEEYKDHLEQGVSYLKYRHQNLTVDVSKLVSNIATFEALKQAIDKSFKQLMDDGDFDLFDYIDVEYLEGLLKEEIKEAREITQRKNAEAAAKRKATMEANKAKKLANKAAEDAKRAAVANQASIVVPLDKKEKAEEALRKLGLLY